MIEQEGTSCSPCQTLASDLHAYFRQELSPEEAAGVETHLAGSGCTQCDAALREMRLLHDLLESPELRPAAPAEDLFARIQASIAADDAGARRDTEDGGRLSPGRRESDDGRRER